MRKITVCLALMLAIIIVPGVIFAQAVSTEEQFITAVEEGKAVEISKNINIKLEKDITITEKVTIGAFSGSNNTVTLDLNGHAVKLNGSNAQFFIQKKGTLIIEDSVGTGLITNVEATAYNQYPIQITGNCEINGGTLENTLSNPKTIYIQNGATCTLNNGTIKNLYEKGGQAVKIGNGTFIMNGGKVENKAAGSTGLASAIEGNKVIMTGGTIEAAGTGITATGQSVEITGGTIKAGWFGVFSRYANIKPAEGKEINISAGKALMMAYSTPSSGKSNKIYGGNFDAPILLETSYGYDKTNVEVYGGLFAHTVSAEYLAPGYVVNKVNNKYEVKLNTPNIVDDDLKEDKEVEIGVVPELKEKLEEIFKQEIEKNEKIQEALLDGKSVNIHIQLGNVEEENIKVEELDSIKEVSKDKQLAKFYDITLVVKADEIQIDTISEISNKLKFKVLIPEELIKEDRTFFMYRYHNGEVEEITGEVTEDNYFIFESDKFSTYVLAYEDKVEEQPEQDNAGDKGTVTPPVGEEDNSGKGEAVQQPEEDNTGNEGTAMQPDGEEDNIGKGETEQQPEVKPEVKPTTPDVPKTGDNVMLYVALAAISAFGILKVKKANTLKRKH